MPKKLLENIFIRATLVDKIKLTPSQIGSNLKEILQYKLQHKFEGKYSYHGYIKNNTIKVHEYSMGKIFNSSLNGDVEYMVQYQAEVCNPSIGSIVTVIVTKKNSFGVLTEYFIDDEKNNKKTSILEIVVVNSHSNNSALSNQLNEGDVVNVEILGKKFELNDKVMSARGKIVKSKYKNTLDQVELAHFSTNEIEGENMSIVNSDSNQSDEDVDEDENEDIEDNEDNEDDEDDERVKKNKKKKKIVIKDDEEAEEADVEETLEEDEFDEGGGGGEDFDDIEIIDEDD
jgi:DNA-directed RNA polymerase subunit E'/Rpb7